MATIPAIVTCPVCGRPMPRGERIRLSTYEEFDKFQNFVNPHKPWWKWRSLHSFLLCRQCYESVNETLWRLKDGGA